MLLLFLKITLALFFDSAYFSLYIIGRRSFINNTKSWTLAKGKDYFLTVHTSTPPTNLRKKMNISPIGQEYKTSTVNMIEVVIHLNI